MNPDGLRLFALGSSRGFGQRMAEVLGVPLADHEEREFEDGEHKARSLVNVRGRDVFVVHSLHGELRTSVNDKLCRLLFFLGACRDAGAARVTAVVPYLAYARKDRKTKARDPLTLRYVAQLLEAVGTDRVVTMDVHDLAAFQNAFRIGTEHLEARGLFARHFAGRLAAGDVVVVSPDVGGVKRAEAFRQALEARIGRPAAAAFMEKQRSGGVISGDRLVGDVRGRTAILLDDLVGSGTTLLRAARACREAGAAKVLAAATHGLFFGKAGDVVADPAFDGFTVTNTLPPFRLDPALVARRVTLLDGAGLFGEAVRRIHEGGSIVELLEQA